MIFKNKAIFLDRDGTINREVGYLSNINDIEIFPGVIEALSEFRNLGFKNIVVTNQSAIARGLISEDQLTEIHNNFRYILTSEGKCLLDDIIFSPYHEDGVIEQYKTKSFLRKPNPGMILKAAFTHNLSLKNSFMIGDAFSDMLCAKYAGIKKVLVLSGYGRETQKKCKNEGLLIDFVTDNLKSASEIIKKYLEN